ncbi:hypothetical protein [Ramlibacter sp.]|uniref:hypothetical protein n=1 Tax=Ramlibacter sp. TaxID=1917967 RepID=UPI002C24B1B8|nr:hypothetical protein [Ramlibacter sp.]HWI81571.1 hypothetical protein [Ramlibacter sp.]
MEVARGRTRVEAWLDTVGKITPGGRVYNLITEIAQPMAVTPQSRAVEAIVDRELRDNGHQPLVTVAETIFPMTEYKQRGLQGVFDYPNTIFPLIRSVAANNRGTYALRLVQRRCSDGTLLNPLELMIDKMKAWLAREATRRAIYEIDVGLEAAELKFYDAEIDNANHIGGQCLSHLSFKLGDNSELYLTAMYRYQYMLQKGLGNYKGLASLQAVVARELGIEVGPLVVHATLAFLDVSTVGGMNKYNALVSKCSEALQSAPVA